VPTLKTSPGTLHSWKEIAQYLDRGVRTIQRWEHGLGLPVHRIGKGKRSPVFATASELNFWLSTVVERPSKPPQLEPAFARGVDNPRIRSLRQSCQTMRNLSHTMAENCARQRKQAELARAQIDKLRLHINRAAPLGNLAISSPLSLGVEAQGSLGMPPPSAVRNGRC
jgi:hypothetical protein